MFNSSDSGPLAMFLVSRGAISTAPGPRLPVHVIPDEDHDDAHEGRQHPVPQRPQHASPDTAPQHAALDHVRQELGRDELFSRLEPSDALRGDHLGRLAAVGALEDLGQVALHAVLEVEGRPVDARGEHRVHSDRRLSRVGGVVEIHLLREVVR